MEWVSEFEYDAEISVMNADGTGREDLTTGPAFKALPAFSPTGNKIVFSKMTFTMRSEESDLVVMRADGTNKRPLTDTARSFEYDADWQALPLEMATPE